MSRTLHLVLKSKWYDLIDCGKKTSEYRECKPYWNGRLAVKYDTVVFHKGYTATTMEFEIEFIGTTTAPNDLGLDKCWQIKLGRRIIKGGDNE